MPAHMARKFTYFVGFSSWPISPSACPRYGAGEVFCPVCLPGYNPEMFLHAHIDYLDKDAGMYLVLLSGR